MTRGLYLFLAVFMGVSPGVFAADLDSAMSAYRGGRFSDAYGAFRELAAAGNAEAQFRLGLMYHQGRGAPRNYAEALAWYRQSAAQGNAMAQNNLGVMYRDGQGIRSNRVLAYMWFSLAAAQFEDRAQRAVRSLQEEMSREEELQAQQLTTEYMEKLWADKRTVAAESPAPVAVPRFMVQLGLFGKASNVERIRLRLKEADLPVVTEPVEVRGKRYQRVRVGPFSQEDDAEAVARRMDALFRLKSLVVPVSS
ncbi:MAG: SPOR domain-containing protein [Gammaproteobacteria bacterium]